MTTVLGTNGADLLYGSDDDDAIYAAGGNDLIIGGTGADDIFGGAGNDTAQYDNSWEGVVVSLITGQGFNGTAEGDTLASIENLTGSAYADTLFGNNGNNVLTGAQGDDILNGGGGADTLSGGTGGDTLKGGGGADALDGGSGVDTADYSASSVGVSVSLIGGSGSGGDAEGDQLSGIECLTGSAYDDVFWGDDGYNVLRGQNGTDTLKGFGGNDYLYGGADNDTLVGMDGNDRLYGGDGNDTLWGMDGKDWVYGEAGIDTLYGGGGADNLWGGASADVFRWDETSETGVTLVTSDWIYDFNRLEGDEFNLSGIDADVYAAGDQAFTFIGMAAFSGTPGEVRYYQSGGNTYIEMQTGTSVDIEGMIVLDGVYAPEANWFLL